MNFFSQISVGLSAHKTAISFIFKHNLWLWFLAPLIINVLLFIGGFFLVFDIVDSVNEIIIEYLGIADADFWGASILMKVLSGFLGLLFHLLFILIYGIIGGYIVLMLLSPVYAFLSEKTENIISGREYLFDLNQFITDIVRGVGIALRNMFIELFIIALIFIVGFFPLIGQLLALISPLLLFLLSSYFYGFSFMDYSLERRKLSINQSVKIIRKNKGLAMTNGGLFSTFVLIPYIGPLLGGFISIISVVASTISIQDIIDNDIELNNKLDIV